MNWDALLRDFIALWVVIDPIGSIPVFLAFTKDLDPGDRRRVAFKATAIAAVVLLLFVAGGQLLLDALDISLAAFQLAGGIVLFLFALTMIFGEGKPEREKHEVPEDPYHVAVFPIAIPSLASPGAMLAVVLLTDNNRHSLAHQAGTSAMMLAVIGVVLLLFLAAEPIQRWLGSAGASIVSRVMGLILASVAVDNVLKAISGYFGLG